MDQPIRDAASATTYRGFSAVPPRRAGRAAQAPAQRSGALPLALVAAAVAAGLAWFLTTNDKTLKPAAPPAAAPTHLRAETAISPAAPARILPVERVDAAAPQPSHPVIVRKTPRVAHPAPPSRAAAAPVRAAFHCDWRLRRSERMICGDARLTQLDRQLNHAYGEAVAAGVPRARLRREQDAWVYRREAAARSPATLAAYYQRRIRDLEAMASPAHRRRRR